MNRAISTSAAGHDSIVAPLRYPVYRAIWLASLMSNFGLLVQGVGAAWAMTEMASSAQMVALVQTALMLPVMLIAIPAGAAADMYDRRKVILAALLLSLGGASLLSTLALLGLVSPALLLLLTFVIGSGMALFGPAWQASVSEQVPPEALASAVALNSISFNIARSFGPAVGGIIVAVAGAVGAFFANAILYLPLLAVIARWQRVEVPPRLPPESMSGAIISGARYIFHSPTIRIVLFRTFLTGVAGGSVSALMPLVARDLLGGSAQIYGIMLGMFGMGAVSGAVNIALVRRTLSAEWTIRLAAMLMGLAISVIALSHSSILTGLALILAGAGWMVGITIFNIGIQLRVPRWVAGRALAGFQAAIAGGIAFGSWFWGHVATGWGVETALLGSGIALALLPLFGHWLPMPASDVLAAEAQELPADPEVTLKLTPRSGPIIIEIEYQVDPADARSFYAVMQKVQLSRQRNGAYGWSLARDIAQPELWTERFHCPTWLDYLRQRTRATEAERMTERQAAAYHKGPVPRLVRRKLDRPLGSVRWKDRTPDQDGSGNLSPPAGV
ncbi:MFS transporter [Sphingobium sp. JS3065]|uniref:MFS transporter n=1 Tax=Sphingobium sp. JS3065 TaxID=2970925 RepID=UPI0022650FAF|nr:MFS transporter [Sphingobium sp. JS3065]UZW57661.1 MFS transporter [Sphingobium sp. JS3065]